MRKLLRSPWPPVLWVGQASEQWDNILGTSDGA